MAGHFATKYQAAWTKCVEDCETQRNATASFLRRLSNVLERRCVDQAAGLVDGGRIDWQHDGFGIVKEKVAGLETRITQTTGVPFEVKPGFVEIGQVLVLARGRSGLAFDTLAKVLPDKLDFSNAMRQAMGQRTR